MANNQGPRLHKYLNFFSMVVLLLFGFSVTAFGLDLLKPENPISLFHQANGCYQKGDYNKAVDIYRQLLANGYQSGNLYYNLGNTYFKLGQTGMAVLYYEKAKHLIPGDADLNANLAYVRNKTGESIPGPWYHQLNQFLAYLATIDQLTASSSILFFLLLALLIYTVLFPQKIKNETGGTKPLWLYGIFVISLVFLVVLSITALTIREQTMSQAVAVNETTEVRFEPNSTATLYYELKEGAVVYLLQEKNGWALIRRPDGKRGWVEEKNIVNI